jgi:hypothetical protein
MLSGRFDEVTDTELEPCRDHFNEWHDENSSVQDYREFIADLICELPALCQHPETKTIDVGGLPYLLTAEFFWDLDPNSVRYEIEMLGACKPLAKLLEELCRESRDKLVIEEAMKDAAVDDSC